MKPTRGRLLLIATLAVALTAVGLIWHRASRPEEPKAPSLQVQVPPKKATVEEALKDASLIDLIRNARVATRKGDEVTRTAMVTGLKKEPARAKTLIEREIVKHKDPTDKAILAKIGTEIP